MCFNLDVRRTEEDYLSFNTFHIYKAQHVKKYLLKKRITTVSIALVLMACELLILGWTTFSITFIISLGLYTLLYMLLFRRMLIWRTKGQLKQLKKTGKLPFDPIAKFEFHEDRLVEITADKRIEQNYSAIERVCVVKDKYVFLYNSTGAYLLPIPQIREQINEKEFFYFLFQKCNTFEYY